MPVPGGPVFHVQTIASASSGSVLFASGYTSQATYPPTTHAAILPLESASGVLTKGTLQVDSTGTGTGVVVDPATNVVVSVEAATSAGTTVSTELTPFDFTPGTGFLSQATPLGLGSGSGTPLGAAFDPSGTYFFVTNGKSITGVPIDTSGFLAGLNMPTIATTATTNALVIDPTGSNLFAGNADGTVSVYQIGMGGNMTVAIQSVSVEPAGATPLAPASVLGMALDPTGTLLVTANGPAGDVSLLQLLYAPLAPGSTAPGLLLNLVGTPYAIPGAVTAPAPSSVVYNGNGTVVYVANTGSNSVSVLDVSLQGLSPVAGSPFALPTGDTAPLSLAVSR
jgi:DNA-binding beta-propeller fold protein YncE